MWKKAVRVGVLPWRIMTSRYSSNVSSSTVTANLLRSLLQSYTQLSKTTPPPKVNPPSPFTVVKGALDNDGPVLIRTCNEETIGIWINMDPDNDGDNSALFLYVHILKPTQTLVLQFDCALYPNALRILSVSMQQQADLANNYDIPNGYDGPSFLNLDPSMKDAVHGFIEARGINESLYPFLQTFIYVKNHKNLLRWFNSVGVLITDPKQATIDS